jgi:MoxR-like ATPase
MENNKEPNAVPQEVDNVNDTTDVPVKEPTDPNEISSTLFPSDVKKDLKLLKQITDSMLIRGPRPLMLGGDTGLGKTSAIKQFGRIFGLPVVTIEVPHITEEELINIPYIVTLPGGSSEKGNDLYKGKGQEPELVSRDKYGITMAKSHLAAKLEQLSQFPDGYIENLNSNDRQLLDAFLSTASGKRTYAIVRNNYSKVLFLDEFFRQHSPTIINILRNMLNGQIGNDPIPAGTYIIYASNLSDTGGALASQSQHTGFRTVEISVNKNAWLNYMTSHNSIKKDIVDTFYKILTDETLSYRDRDTNIRTSPRRWSEIMLYINTVYPFTSAEQVSILQTSILRQFRTEGKVDSGILIIAKQIIESLAKKSGIDPKELVTTSPAEWQNILAQNVLGIMQAGENKKYVPVVVGLPGVGKTTKLVNIFEKPPYNLRTITILASSLTVDDISGIPLGNANDKGEYETEFAKSSLATLIDNKVSQSIQTYKDRLSRSGNNGKQAFTDWENQKYKYIIFFDEINRVKTVAVFNALRRVILEKSFNDIDKLPSGSIVIAAMNPSDTGGTTIPMTEHFKDAIEIIDAEPDWKSLMTYLETIHAPELLKNSLYEIHPAAIQIALKSIERWPATFAPPTKSKIQTEFRIAAGINSLYLSPRDYIDIFVNLVKVFTNVMDDDINSPSLKNELTEAGIDSITAFLSNLFYQAKLSMPEGFEDTVGNFLSLIVNSELVVQTEKPGMDDIIKAYYNGTEIKENNEFSTYIDGMSSPNAFKIDVAKHFEKLVDDAKDTESLRLVIATKEPGSIYWLYYGIVAALDAYEIDPNYIDVLKMYIDDLYTHINKTRLAIDTDPDAFELLLNMNDFVSDEIDKVVI